MMKKVILLSFVFVLLAGVSSVFAIPALQLYIEGSEYDMATETWLLNSSSSFTLWVLGDVGSVGTIEDVRLAFAYDSTESGSVTFIGTTTSLLDAYSIDPSGLGDPSTPSTLTTLLGSGSDGPPLMGDGEKLPPHGIYEDGVSWGVFSLGDFTLTDSPIGNYSPDDCPDGACSYPTSGQINAYTVDISGYTWVHFDAYGLIDGASVFAPFSHDAATPEPATLVLLGSGLLGLFGGMRRRKRV